ncbi:MAG: DEAD/DEAH box helicase [Burkholderiaceae bacterium]
MTAHDGLGRVDAPASFAALGLAPPLVKALAGLGIGTPTPIQASAIPAILDGRDLIATAPTGTGKTAAFLLPVLQRLTDPTRRADKGRGPRVLVLTPTRELAQQVSKAARDLSRTLPRLSTVCVTGGEPYHLQLRQLAAPHEILVATPGRLMDHMGSRRVDLGRVEVLVLDEADRMLDMGFADDVTEIARAISADRQTLCFTATISRAVRALAGELLRDPAWLNIEREQADEAPIDDHVIYVDDAEHRDRLLVACLTDEGLGQAIVFTATKQHAHELSIQLHRQGISSQALHGDLSQRDRTRALNKLRRGECKVLVATDVAARGIDVSSVTHVINYALPKFAEDYVHRIGRTGRAGASGQALSFVGHEDVIHLNRIEHFLGRHVQVSEIEGLEARFKPQPRKRPKKAGGRGGPNRGSNRGPRGQQRGANPDSPAPYSPDGGRWNGGHGGRGEGHAKAGPAKPHGGADRRGGGHGIDRRGAGNGGHGPRRAPARTSARG